MSQAASTAPSGAAPAEAVAGAAATSRTDTLLELKNVTTHYGPIRVLHDVDMVIYPGEMVCLLGGNASGKSTTLKTILGLVRVSEGEMYFRGQRADNLNTAERIERGMAVVPENRRIFPRMTVRENLEMGAFLRNDRKAIAEDMEGFGVAMACKLAGVPLRIVRGISNRAGDRDLTQWQIEEALAAAAERASALIAAAEEVQ